LGVLDEADRPTQLDTFVEDEDRDAAAELPADRGAERPKPADPTAAVDPTAAAILRGTARIGTSDLGSLRSEQRVGGYLIQAELGRGGCGTVYRAFDPKHDRQVALKLYMRTGLRSRERFRREVQAIARLSHPAIVPLFDSGESKDHAWMVMELIDGTDLADVAEARAEGADDALDPQEVARIVREIAGALHYAHGEGILHRDIKPHNILLDRQGRPYLADFGLASFQEGWDRLTKTGAILGTPAYMSPEQVHPELPPPGERSDVYSLGAALFHALTGATPFADCESSELPFAIVQAPVQPPSVLQPEIPPALDAIVLRCLAKDPCDRYSSAEALGDDLDRFLRGEAVRASGAGRGALSALLARRGPALAFFLLLVAFLILMAKYELLVLQEGR
jgi:serine/threonine-protein kinase